MCGIAAIYCYRADNYKVNPDELTAIRDQMVLRGPDGFGEWISPDRRLGLGHRRLAIIDLSPTGAQPMHSVDDRYVIVFNGEIYNYRELRAELESLGRRFRSQCDTEVILEGFAVWDSGVLERLRGMYAFALWDKRENRLFAARDPFGIKPLYVADDGRTLRLASQVKALLAGGQLDRTPEPAGHVGFFIWGNVRDPYTLYRGIRALPAGASLDVRRGGSPKTTVHAKVSEFLVGDPAPGAVPSLAAALEDSVTHHLLADVPVGVFLSSGLDSSTLTALALRQAKSVPIMAAIKARLIQIRQQIGPEGKLAQACDYALGQWSRLEQYLSDGQLE